MSKERVPCSKCGETFIVNIPTGHLPDPTKDGYQTYHAACSECGCKGPECMTKEEAYTAWNEQEGKVSLVAYVRPKDGVILYKQKCPRRGWEILKGEAKRIRQQVEAIAPNGIVPDWPEKHIFGSAYLEDARERRLGAFRRAVFQRAKGL